MSFKTFNEWLSQRDIFGFDKERQQKSPKNRESEHPIMPLKTEAVIKDLLRHNINNKAPTWDWEDTITWGNPILGEAIQLDISPLGSLKIIIRKAGKNLMGEHVWLCKKIIPLPDESRGNEETIGESVIEDLIKFDLHTESPADAYDLGKLAFSMANELKVHRPCRQMYFEKLIRKSDNYFIITHNLSGQGVQAPDSMRVEQFQIELFFDKEVGLIRCFGHDVSSPTRQHEWRLQPSEWDEYFAPSQNKKEIIKAVLEALSTY